MKRILALFLAMAIVMCCVGCGASNSSADTVTTEAIVTETQPQETETVIQESTEAEVIEEVADEYVMTNLGGGAKAEEYFPEVIDLRMYAPKNGYTRFEVDYKAPEGLRPVAVAYVAEEHVKAPEGIVTDAVTYVKDKQQASYWHEAEEKTTGEEQTFAFEIETDVLEESNGPEIHFCDENYESITHFLSFLDMPIDTADFVFVLGDNQISVGGSVSPLHIVPNTFSTHSFDFHNIFLSC